MHIEEYLAQPYSAPSKLGTLSEWLDVGELEIGSGILAVGDCVLLPSDQIEVSVVPGIYYVQARILNFGLDRRISHLRAGLPGSVSERQTVGSFPVDFAVAGVYNLHLFMEAFEPFRLDTEKWEKEYGDKLAGRYGILTLSQEQNSPARMIFVQTGWGDGVYEVSSLISQQGVIGIEVTFVEPDEEFLFEGKSEYDIIPGKALS